MPRPHRRINQIYDPVLSVQITATKVKRLVYFLIANRPVRYGEKGHKKGYSRIVYIGTTERGVRRIATSASYHIAAAGELKGIRRLDAYIVWVKSKKGPQTKKGMKLWAVLERAMLLCFREMYGEPPRLNKQGRKMKPKHEFDTFSKRTIVRVINRYT
ncbi:MAG: hypothetical protein HY459_04495 [Parcubacteria group bacterium]|nr:hypothetical protein [Parcubacteria group bacterium]